MQQRHGFPADELQRALGTVSYEADIITAISRPAEAKPWYRYRSIFVTPERARGGLAYWNAQEAVLRKASEAYGVPPEVLVAIIGVETRYGRNTGRYRALDALSTLAFGYPPRGDFFRGELESLLLLSREQGLTLGEVRGSYAGALGKPQFIPSSYRRFAVDFDGDGRKDLLSNDADAIGSVANYLREHGWRTGDPIVVPVQIPTAPPTQWEAAGMKPSIPLGDLGAAGIRLAEGLADTRLASLIRLETEGASEYWLGFDNFYAITRYNHSNLYAMAVYQPSREILALKAGEEGARGPR
jgi:membrane-bound lytic murein transglycosylase B